MKKGFLVGVQRKQKERISQQYLEGELYSADQRYHLHEQGRADPRSEITITSGHSFDIWLGVWISGHAEGDGEDYYFFAHGGGKCRLCPGMKARCTR